MGRIWLVGGTQESAQLAIAIAHSQILCTITVTTESARSLYPNAPNLLVWVGRLTFEQLREFFHQQQIVATLDASHPYAVEISKSAIALCHEFNIPYLRYERPVLEETRGGGEGGTTWATGVGARKGVIYLDGFKTLVEGNYLEGERVLLTVGYRHLHLFMHWQERATLYARLLPSQTTLEAAFSAGFTPDRIICLRPPISVDLEAALWRQWQISLVVTKASGSAGGEDVKRKVAAKLGVSLVVITRPDVAYGLQTSDLLEALEFCRKYSDSQLSGVQVICRGNS
ncbi:MAG: cobalt-precorrin-6A reductase [Heteroscytonema crispum UTEX LB 1556]